MQGCPSRGAESSARHKLLKRINELDITNHFAEPCQAHIRLIYCDVICGTADNTLYQPNEITLNDRIHRLELIACGRFNSLLRRMSL